MPSIIQSLVLALFLAALALPAGASGFLVVTENNPPFNFVENDKVTGFATDILMEMSRIAKLPIYHDEILVWPWARGYQELQNSPNVLLYSMSKTPERAPQFQWIGPILKVKGVLVARKDKHIRITDLAKDTANYRIGSVRESASEQTLISEGIDKKRLHRIHDLDLNVKKLQEGRIDILAMNEPAFFYFVQINGYNADAYEVVHVLATGAFYYGVSKDMDSGIVRRLQDALDTLKASGRADAIINKYQ